MRSWESVRAPRTVEILTIGQLLDAFTLVACARHGAPAGHGSNALV
jgi:hypothetical protein